MHDDELHRFKSDIHLVHFAADRYGYQRDRRESSVSSHVLRHAATNDKIVVRRDQDGHWTYFSVRDDRDHGTIVDFVQHRGRYTSLGSVREELRQWLGTARPVPEWARSPVRPAAGDRRSVAEVFEAARVVDTCAYLSSRGLRPETLSDPRFAGTWRLGARGNVLFAHTGAAGEVTGFEVKNRGFTGFAAGGTKTAWRSAAFADDRALVVTESAIDALSYHQLHAARSGAARYVSTAGAPSAAQLALLETAFSRMPPESTVVAAFDSDKAGRKLASRLASLVRGVPHVAFRHDAPSGAKDWNDVLQRVERDFIRSFLALGAVRSRTERER
jgi:hypothetical protein